MNYAAVDFETYYDKECSVTTLGVDGYIAHPQFDAYLVSIVASTGFEWVGHPAEAPWHKISGLDWEWLAHNAAFDERIFDFLIPKRGLSFFGWRDERILATRVWHCTADLCAYSGVPRSLSEASRFLYDEKVSKTVRDKMKGVIFATLSPEKQEEVRQYALVDGRKCLKFWTDLSSSWPEKERRLSRLTREMAWRGARIDVDRVRRGIQSMQLMCWAARSKIPWADQAPALSYPRLVAECQKHSIEAPDSLAKDSASAEAWEDKYSTRFPWIGAMRINRRCNALLKKLETILARVRPDGTIPTELKYFGAGITGRWSGSGGINWQNLSRTVQFGPAWWEEEAKAVIGDLVFAGTDLVPEGVDLRRCLIPRDGNHFLVPDLEQIEPRCGAVIVRDAKFVELLAQGQSPYDAHAVATGMSEPHPESLKTRNKPLYNLAKARELALSYAAGHHKFIVMAPLYVSKDECDRIFSAPVSEYDINEYEKYLGACGRPAWDAKWKSADEKGRTQLVNSWLIVEDFRAKKPKTVAMWKRLQRAIQSAVGEDLEIYLPSGRPLRYRKVANTEMYDTETKKKLSHTELTAIAPQFGKMARQKFYGGALFNNVVQGTARDVFAECWLRLDDAGYQAVLSVHDELVFDVPRSVTPDEIKRLMSVAPEWMPTLPVSAECQALDYYTK